MNTSAPFPPAPWRLIGTSVQALRLVSIEAARAALPATLRVVPFAPGKTLGALFCARYEVGSTLEYHELAISPALTRVGCRPGFWISHIYVDSPASMLGGRSIWSLPKQLARFDWREGSIDVFDGSTQLCGIRWQSSRFGIPVPLILPAFSEHLGQFYHFSVLGHAAVKLGRASIAIGPRSPFTSLAFQAVRAVLQARLHARIDAPGLIDAKRER